MEQNVVDRRVVELDKMEVRIQELLVVLGAPEAIGESVRYLLVEMREPTMVTLNRKMLDYGSVVTMATSLYVWGLNRRKALSREYDRMYHAKKEDFREKLKRFDGISDVRLDSMTRNVPEIQVMREKSELGEVLETLLYNLYQIFRNRRDDLREVSANVRNEVRVSLDTV